MAVECVAKTLHISADQGIEEVEGWCSAGFLFFPLSSVKDPRDGVVLSTSRAGLAHPV